MATIGLDYDKVLKQVDRLSSTTQATVELTENHYQLLEDLSGSWEGVSASQFAAALKEWNFELFKIRNTMSNIKSDIKKIADAIQAADKAGHGL